MVEFNEINYLFNSARQVIVVIKYFVFPFTGIWNVGVSEPTEYF